jgi:hypothetical protein
MAFQGTVYFPTSSSRCGTIIPLEGPSGVFRKRHAQSHIPSTALRDSDNAFLSVGVPTPRRDFASRRIFQSLYSSAGGGKQGFSFLEDATSRGDLILSYLPDKGRNLPIDTFELLKRASSQYVYGKEMMDEPITREEVLDVIEREHLCTNVPVSVGNTTFNQSPKSEKMESSVSRILAFALIHQLPSEIAVVLLGSKRNLPKVAHLKDPVFLCKEALRHDGWKALSFPMGVGLRMRPGIMSSLPQRLVPQSRSLFNSRKRAREHAESILAIALESNPPAKITATRKQFLRAMEQEMSATASPLRKRKTPPKQARRFFPLKNAFVERFRRMMQSQAHMLEKAGRAGGVAYGFLNFALYAGGTIWQWHRISVAPSTVISSSLLSLQLKKLGRVLATVYLGSQVTKLPRIFLAIALAPLGDRALRSTQNNLGVSENVAFGILAAILVGSFLSIIAFIMLGSTAIGAV